METINFAISELLNYFSQKKQKNAFYCNLCKKESSYFLHTSNKKRILYDSICPNCNSRKRHRGLFEVYKNILKSWEKPKILHFAPEPVFYSLFKLYDYVTADISLTDVDLKLDIKDTNLGAKTFDLILCNHVLEHIDDDLKAINELERILKPLGRLILTVPGDWEREKIIKYKRPDGNGHYRDYGLELIKILNKKFDEVNTLDLYEYNKLYRLPLGLTVKHDLAILCHKI